MVTQVLGDSEADALAATIMEFARSRELSGDLSLEVPVDAINIKQKMLDELHSVLADQLDVGPVAINLPIGTILTGELSPHTRQRIHKDAWTSHIKYQQSLQVSARAYANGSADGDYVLDPLTLILTGPQKSPETLSKDLWEKKFKKAAKQCSGTRGAILVFEWESITDPSIFAEPNIFHGLTASTFVEYPHIARIVMRCDNEPIRSNGEVGFIVYAYTVTNDNTPYPDVTQFMQLDEPLL